MLPQRSCGQDLATTISGDDKIKAATRSGDHKMKAATRSSGHKIWRPHDHAATRLTALTRRPQARPLNKQGGRK